MKSLILLKYSKTKNAYSHMMEIFFQDPQSSIPKGTLLSIVITSVTYMLMAFVAGFTVRRDATGNVEDYINGTIPICAPGECKYGLHNSFQVTEIQGTRLIHAY